MTVTEPRAACRAALAAGSLAVVSTGLWLAGRGLLALPASSSWGRASAWYAAVGPAVATIAAVRGAALLISVWLLVGCLLELAASVVGRRWARQLADVIAPRSLQRLVHGLAGLSLTAGLAVAAPSAGTPVGDGGGVAVLRVVDEAPAGSGTATMRLVDEAPPAAPAALPASVDPPHDVVVVEPGDCFWSISAEVLTDALGRAPDEREIATHWRRFVAANRDRLVDPHNPDLLYPGQELVLPS